MMDLIRPSRTYHIGCEEWLLNSSLYLILGVEWKSTLNSWITMKSLKTGGMGVAALLALSN